MNLDRLQLRSTSTSVIIVLTLVFALETVIGRHWTDGVLSRYIIDDRYLDFGLMLRATALVLLLICWFRGRRSWLFKMIILCVSIQTVGLVVRIATLVDLLFGFSAELIIPLLEDVVLVGFTNVLIFATWYWIIDPPGIDDQPRVDEPCELLFPQRASGLAEHDGWVPGFTDYLFLSFTTSLTFSPADVVPLSKRAKWIMMLQASASVVVVVVIAGTALGLIGAQ